MQFKATGVFMLHDQERLTVVLFNTRIGKLAQLFNKLLFKARIGRDMRGFFRAEAEHAARITIFKVERVAQRRDLLRIALQNHRLWLSV
ncbi:hypothetical protein D3C75_1210360 [compost metagenome]